jgi:thiol-disulfide isomerase/thioredoxin
MKYLYSLILLLLPYGLFADGGHDIKIKIKGFPKDSTARIGYYFGKARYMAEDTARADKNGLLVFKGKKKLPEGVYICLMPKTYFEFLVTEQEFSLETDTADLEMHMKVKGSQENKIFYEYRRFTTNAGRKADSLNRLMKKKKNPDSIKVIKEQMRAIDKEVEAYRKDFTGKYPFSFTVKLIRALPDPEIPETPLLKNGQKDSSFPYRYFKAHYFDKIDFSDDRMVRTPFFEAKLENYFKNLVLPIPDSVNKDADALIEKARAGKEVFKYTVSWILNYYEESQYMGMDAVAVHIIEKYYFTGQTPWVSDDQLYRMRQRDSTVRNLLIGKKMPDIYGTDSTGKLIRLYSVNKKYTIVWLWDATCGHCQHATPILHKFYQQKKDSLGLAVYAITIERKTNDWKKYIKDNHLDDWINVWDGMTVTDFKKVFDIYSTPVMYILDANKVILAKRVDVDKLQEVFDKLEHERIEKEKEKSKKP